MNQYIFSVILLFTLVHKAMSGMNGSNWMMYINDTLKLNQINIPGTHDSATFSLNSIGIEDVFAQTQNYNFKEQLKSGVRYLDIRLKNLNGSDDVTINHGSVKCKSTLKDVLNACREFLKENPSETVIIHLKNEGPCDEPHFNGLINQVEDCSEERKKRVNNLTKDCYHSGSIPTLFDAQGKIVIVSREREYNGIFIGIPYNEIEPKPINRICANYCRCRFQDASKLPLEEKWEAVKNLLDVQEGCDQNESYNEDILAINFMNTSTGNIENVSNEIGKKLIKYGLKRGKQYGWIVGDYMDEFVAYTIYNSNNIINPVEQISKHVKDGAKKIYDDTKKTADAIAQTADEIAQNVNKINQNMEKKYVINTEKVIFTEDQVKHLYNGDEAHDRCIRKIKDVVWYRGSESSIKEHLNMDNIRKYCNRYNCVKAYAPGGSCKNKEEYWNTCKKNIINETLNPWIKGDWKVKNINHC